MCIYTKHIKVNLDPNKERRWDTYNNNSNDKAEKDISLSIPASHLSYLLHSLFGRLRSPFTNTALLNPFNNPMGGYIHYLSETESWRGRMTCQMPTTKVSGLLILAISLNNVSHQPWVHKEKNYPENNNRKLKLNLDVL